MELLIVTVAVGVTLALSIGVASKMSIRRVGPHEVVYGHGLNGGRDPSSGPRFTTEGRIFQLPGNHIQNYRFDISPFDIEIDTAELPFNDGQSHRWTISAEIRFDTQNLRDSHPMVRHLFGAPRADIKTAIIAALRGAYLELAAQLTASEAQQNRDQFQLRLSQSASIPLENLGLKLDTLTLEPADQAHR